MLQTQTPAAAWGRGLSHVQNQTHVPGYAFCKMEGAGGRKKKKMQLHKFLGLSGTEELSLKAPPGRGLPCTPAVGTNTWHCKSNCWHWSCGEPIARGTGEAGKGIRLPHPVSG